MAEFLSFKKISAKAWDDFCLQSDDAWFRHTSASLQYCLSLNNQNENLSLGFVENNNLVAAIPLIKQPIAGADNLFEFGMGGDPTPFPALAKDFPDAQALKTTKSIFAKIDELATTNDIAYAKFFVDPLSRSALGRATAYNPFLKFGFNEISLTTNSVDLVLPEDELFQNMRDTYRYDIRSAAKLDLTVDFFDQTNITNALFNTYKDIYFSAAGKEVGTPARWDATLDLMKSGFSILALLKNKSGEYISGVTIFSYKKNAYYASGATSADFKKTNGIGHLLQWELIKYLKRQRFAHYELGHNLYPVISGTVPNPKEVSISFFKSGFGRKILPLFRGEKFYQQDYLRKKKSDLVEKYIKYYMADKRENV